MNAREMKIGLAATALGVLTGGVGGFILSQKISENQMFLDSAQRTPPRECPAPNDYIEFLQTYSKPERIAQALERKAKGESYLTQIAIAVVYDNPESVASTITADQETGDITRLVALRSSATVMGRLADAQLKDSFVERYENGEPVYRQKKDSLKVANQNDANCNSKLASNINMQAFFEETRRVAVR